MGNLDAVRDWGYAKEYVESMWLMLQQDQPSDYVIATGKSATVRDFCQEAFGYFNLNYENYIEIDKNYYRANEVDALIGNPTKANLELGWQARTDWKGLAELMTHSDFERLKHLKKD